MQGRLAPLLELAVEVELRGAHVKHDECCAWWLRVSTKEKAKDPTTSGYCLPGGCAGFHEGDSRALLLHNRLAMYQSCRTCLRRSVLVIIPRNRPV